MVRSAQTSPVGTPPTGWNKRQKSEDHHEGAGPATKKPRTRVSYSCGECHRRKQKCDRQVPCSHCVARKVPDLCKAYTPGKSDQDIPARVSRLEHIIESAWPHFASVGTPSMDGNGPFEMSRCNSVGPDDDAHSQADDAEVPGGTFQSGKWYGDSVSGSIAPATVLEQLQNMVAPPNAVKGSPRSEHSRPRSAGESSKDALRRQTTSPEHNPLLDSVGPAWEPSAADNLKSLVQDCGVSPHALAEILQELPQKRFSDALVDFYFSQINWTRYPISERDFRQSYTSICSNGISAHPNDVRFLPLLFVILAISVRVAPEHIAGSATSRRTVSMRYYWSSRRALLIAAAVQPDSLDMILTRLLSARFLTFDRRITECWSQLGAAVRTAQALGLHRDGAGMNMDPEQVEYRRRIWSYLYHADRSYALVLGRPNAIQDDYTSTQPPLNIEDDYPLTHIRNPPLLSTPTPMTFVILRHALAAIIGRMVHHFQQVRTRSHYSDVLTLDEELMRFVSKLPPHFSMEPDTSLDHTSSYLPVHRYLLITEVLFVRISLHRPYLLRRLASDRYLHSRKACFESALKDFQVRQAFRETMPRDSRASHSNAYREFQTAMVSGIYLVLEPHGKDSHDMHAILDAFMKEHEGQPEMDETTARELKIIEFLKGKSQEGGVHPDGTAPRDPALGGPAMDAQLLLGLQRSSQPSNSAKRPVTRPSFPSLVTSPQLSAAGTPTSIHSPPLMLNNTGSRAPSFRSSPTNLGPETYQHLSPSTGSPPADEESAAQYLLDHWCNTVNGSTMGEFIATAGPPSGSGDYWAAPPPVPLPGDMAAFGALDGSDWTYWETLVNQIRSGPVP